MVQSQWFASVLCFPRFWLRYAGLCISLLPTSSLAYDLAGAVQAAYQYDSSLTVARHLAAAMREQAGQGRRDYLPRVSLDGGARTAFGYDDKRQHPPHATHYRLAVRQPIYDPARLARARVASHREALGELSIIAAEQELTAAVMGQYLEWLTARRLLDGSKRRVAAARVQTANVASEVTVGISSRVHLAEAEALLDESVAVDCDYRARLQKAQRELARLTGLPTPKAEQRLGDVHALHASLPSVAFFNAKTTASNPEILRRTLEWHVSEDVISEQKAGFKPSAFAYFHHDYSRPLGNADGYKNKFKRDNTVGIEISIPLYSGGMVASRVRESRYRAMAARESLDGAHTVMVNQSLQLHEALGTSIKKIDATQRRLASAIRKRDATQAARKHGLRSHLDILKAEKGVGEADASRTRAMHAYYSSYLKLHQNAGLLDTDVIVRISDALKPVAS